MGKSKRKGKPKGKRLRKERKESKWLGRIEDCVVDLQLEKKCWDKFKTSIKELLVIKDDFWLKEKLQLCFRAAERHYLFNESDFGDFNVVGYVFDGPRITTKIPLYLILQIHLDDITRKEPIKDFNWGDESDTDEDVEDDGEWDDTWETDDLSQELKKFLAEWISCFDPSSQSFFLLKEQVQPLPSSIQARSGRAWRPFHKKRGL